MLGGSGCGVVGFKVLLGGQGVVRGLRIGFWATVKGKMYRELYTFADPLMTLSQAFRNQDLRLRI